MSNEQLKNHHEHDKSPETDKSADHELQKNLEKKIEAAEKAEGSQDLEKIRDSIEKTVRKSDEVKIGRDDDQNSAPAPRLDRVVKKNAYKKELQKTRKHLTKPQRAFSKIAHNPVIDSVSEVGAKTVGRPSGLLGGGVVASIGTLILYVMSRYYGFEYNFFVFIALLAIGFLVGILIELVFYPILAKNKQR